MPTPSTPPPTTPAAAEMGSVYREAAVFLAWGAWIILLAHGFEVLHAEQPNWLALAIRVVWTVALLVVASLFRKGRRPHVLAGLALGIFGSAFFDLALLWVTGRSASPLLAFTPVLIMVLPIVAFDALRIGLLGSGALLIGTWLILLVDGAPAGATLVLVNAGGGALVCGWLLARAFDRARRTEVARREELAAAMANIKTLSGLLPVCAWCRRVRGDAGYWQQIEAYVSAHNDAKFTHGLCQDCATKHFPDEPGDQAP